MKTIFKFFWPGIPDDPSPFGAEVRRQQFIQIANAVPVMATASILNACLVAFVCLRLLPGWIIILWLTLIVVSSGDRLFAWYKGRNRSAPAVISRRTIVRSAFWSFLGGVLWGLAGIAMAFQDSIPHHVFLAFVIGGQAAGAAIWMSPAPSSSHAYIWSSTLPLAVALMFRGDPIAVSMGIMTMLYAGAAVRLASGTYGDFLERVRNNLERDQLMAEITGSERRLREVLESSPFGVTVTDIENGHVVFANRRSAKLLNVGRSEIERTPADSYWADPVVRQDFIDEFRQNGRVEGREVRLRRADGSEFWAINAWERYKTSSEEYVLSWIYDITDLRRTQEALLAALNEAESASRAKTEFLASMSHELRTPLNAILGFAQLMDTDKVTALSGLQREAVDQILMGGSHLLDLVDQVLDLAAIEEGRTQIEIEDVEVKALFENIFSFGLSLAASRQITIDRPAIERGYVVRADPTRLRQVLLNLMSNAVKYNRPNGSVSLTCRSIDEGCLRLEVIDTGQGIAPDKQHLVFEPFNRLGAETSSIEGTGIGLTISERLMRMMGGAIGFESTPDIGSTFWLELPAATGADSSADEQETVSGGAGS